METVNNLVQNFAWFLNPGEIRSLETEAKKDFKFLIWVALGGKACLWQSGLKGRELLLPLPWKCALNSRILTSPQRTTAGDGEKEELPEFSFSIYSCTHTREAKGAKRRQGGQERKFPPGRKGKQSFFFTSKSSCILIRL